MAFPDHISELFTQALEISDVPERQRFVRRHCEDNPQLEADLLQMLRVHEQASGFLSRPPVISDDRIDSGINVGRESVVNRLSDRFGLSLEPPASTEPGTKSLKSSNTLGRYQLHGEVARGGMGAILKGRDVDLGRNLAIKVLLESHADNPQIVERFVEEAQIGGQLQHPGIAPVYELGTMPDKRPFFSMKLVKGQTLAALLSERKDPDIDRVRFLGIFEQVCQTMAYAHSRRVIHRDLKPANIMVGAFGEVQVMDWGLAKVLKVGGIADEKRARDTQLGQSLIQTVRSGSNVPQGMVGTKKLTGSGSAAETHAGSVMGTPAYMPPEQALGEVDRLDERCDVFGLGAILCEILTGKPPYVADDHSELFCQAARGRLDQCHHRLDACGADLDLIAIAKASIAPEIEDRLRNARELSNQIKEYLESVDSRLCKAEVERAAERTRVEESRKRRKVATALAASIVLMATLVGGGALWFQVQAGERREAATAQFAEVVNEAKLHQSLGETENLTKRSDEIRKAIASAELALGMFDGGDLTDDQRAEVEELHQTLKQAAKDVESQLAQQSKDNKLRDRLEFMRLVAAGDKSDFDVGGELSSAESGKQETTEQYTQIFLDAGIDIQEMSIDEAATRVKESSLANELIAGLDQWNATIPQPTINRLIGAAAATGNWDIGIEGKRQSIAASEASGRFQAQSYIGLAAMLVLSGQHDEYRKLCRELVFDKPYPGGYALAERVSKTCLLLPKGEMGVSPYDVPTASFAKALDEKRVTPSIAAYVWGTRALAAYRQNQFDECVEFAEQAEQAEYSSLAGALFLAARSMAQHRLDQQDEARESFTKLESVMDAINSSAAYRRSQDGLVAFLLFREAQQLLEPETDALEFAQWADPATAEDDQAVISGYRFRAKLAGIANQADEDAWRIKVRQALMQSDTTTLAELTESDDLRAQSPEMAAWFAAELRREEKLAEAINVLQAAYEDHPGDFWINYEMGRCLARQAKSEEAIGFSRAAVALRPESAGARWSLCIALARAGQEAESNRVFDRLMVDSNVGHESYASLTDDLFNRGHYDKAQRVAEQWLLEFPNSTDAQSWMSSIFERTKNYELSLDWAEKALSGNPKDSRATFNRARSLAQLKRFKDAAEAYRAHIKLEPESYGAHNNLGVVLRDLEDLDGAEAAFREAIRLNPEDQLTLTNLIDVLQKKLRQNPRQRGLYFEIKSLTGQLAQAEPKAIESYRQRLQLNPRATRARMRLITLLIKAGELEEATKEAEKAVAFAPEDANAHTLLGGLYRQQDDLDRAIEHFRTSVELDGEQASYRRVLGMALMEKVTGKRGRVRGMNSNGLVPEYSAVELTQIEMNPGQDKLIDEAIEHLEYAVASSEGGLQYGTGTLVELLRLRGRDADAERIETAATDAFIARMNETRESTGGKWPAFANSPRNRGFNLLGMQLQTLRAEGKTDAALEAIHRFVETNPDHAKNPFLLSMQANLYIEKGEDDKGIATFQQMLVGGSQLQGHLGLARYHRNRGNLQEAEKFYRDGIESLSDSVRGPRSILYAELAEIYSLQDRTEEELKLYEQILEADQSPNEVLTAIRGKYELDGDLAAALDRHGSWKFSGDFPPSLGLWAWLLVAEPREDGKFPDLNAALGYAQDASRSPMREDLTLISSSMRFSLENYFRKREGTRSIYSGKNTLGMVHFRRREYPQALKALQEFYDLGFEEPGNWLFLAMTYWKLDNHEEARKWLKKATDCLDEDGYRVRHSEKLFRAEAEKLITLQ